MKTMNNEAVSQILSAVLLVAVAVVASTMFYIWFTGLQSQTQENVGESVKKTGLRKIGEIGISTIPEYYFQNESEFIQEIAIRLENRWIAELSGVYVRILELRAMSGSLDWVSLQVKDLQLFNRSGSAIASINCSNLGALRYYTKMGEICSLDYDVYAKKREIHIPTYYVGNLRKDEIREVTVVIYVNATIPNDIALKLYVGSDQGLEAEKTIWLRIR